MYYFTILNSKYFLNGNLQYLYSLKARTVNHSSLPEEIFKKINKQKEPTVKNALFTFKYLVPKTLSIKMFGYFWAHLFLKLCSFLSSLLFLSIQWWDIHRQPQLRETNKTRPSILKTGGTCTQLSPPFPQGCSPRLTWRVVPVWVGAGVGRGAVAPQRGVPVTAVGRGQRQRRSKLPVGIARWAQSPTARNQPATHCGETRGL